MEGQVILVFHCPISFARPIKWTDFKSVGLRNFSCYQWKAWNLGSKCEVFDTELFAIKKAIDFAYEKTDIWTREIWIFSDNQAALKRLKSREVRAGQYYTNQARAGIEKLR